MTFLEKAKSEGIEFKKDGMPTLCPYKHGYEEYYICNNVSCKECWNREMPNTEQKFNSKDPLQIEYDKGMNDAWELVRTLYDKKCDELGKIFGIWDSFYEIIRNCTPQEALAKLKAYEDSRIKVGDVVYHDTYGNGIMTREDEDYYNVLLENGDAICFEKESVTKTGKHIDIKSILESIGE